jgi:hypothetical protein
MRRLLGQSEEQEMRTLTRALSTAISSIPALRELRWYRSYDVSPDGEYSLTPEL